MKKTAILLTILLSTIAIKAQNIDVEKSTSGIQTGFLGLWVFNEYKIANKTVLRSEFGFDTGIHSGIWYNRTIYITAPGFTLEPRRYYNIDRRAKKGKNTKNNSANFFAITARFNPNWFSISNENNLEVPNQILIAPKWGVKRNIGSHFNYELGIGLGVRSYFGEKLGYLGESEEIDADIHLRIGYTF